MAPKRVDGISGQDGANAQRTNRRGSVHVSTRGSGGRFTGSGSASTTGAGDASNGDSTGEREQTSDARGYEPVAGSTILESAPASDNPTREVKRRRGRPRKSESESVPVVPEFPSEGTAAELAQDAINTAQLIAVSFAGPAGAMSEVEYSLSTRGLQALIAKTPLAQVSRWASMAAPAVLGAGLLLWSMRMVRASQRKPVVHRAEQVTDPETPATAAPPDTTVSDTRTGDVNGLAVPIPDAILQAARIAGDI